MVCAIRSVCRHASPAVTVFLAVFGFAFTSGVPLFSSQEQSGKTSRQENPEQLIRETVANELTAEQNDHSLWRYLQTRTQGADTQLVAYVETPEGDIHRLVADNGRPLSTTELQKEDTRIHKLLERPKLVRRNAKKESEDGRQERKLLAMLPSAFQYRYVGQENNLIQLDFVPNPSFKPRRMEGRVFHHMRGSIWIDASQKRIARLDGTLTSEVKFADGLLGHLARGGTFLVEQKDLGKDRWELSQLKVNMNGKILFFKTINVQQNEQNSDFSPVSSGISLQEAAKLLKQVPPSEEAKS